MVYVCTSVCFRVTVSIYMYMYTGTQLWCFTLYTTPLHVHVVLCICVGSIDAHLECVHNYTSRCLTFNLKKRFSPETSENVCTMLCSNSILSYFSWEGKKLIIIIFPGGRGGGG